MRMHWSTWEIFFKRRNARKSFSPRLSLSWEGGPSPISHLVRRDIEPLRTAILGWGEDGFPQPFFFLAAIPSSAGVRTVSRSPSCGDPGRCRPAIRYHDDGKNQVRRKTGEDSEVAHRLLQRGLYATHNSGFLNSGFLSRTRRNS